MSVVSPISQSAITASVPAIPTWKRWLPNLLTGGRVVIAIVFVITLSLWTPPRTAAMVRPEWTLITCGILFVIAAVTDVFDGPLARKWNVVSKFGRIMDPFADKLLVMGAFMLLAGPDFQSIHTVDPQGPLYHITAVSPWMVVVIFAREFLVTSLRGMVEAHGVPFGANVWGKLKMFVQSAAAPTIIGMVAVFDVKMGSSGRIVVLIAAWAAVIVTAISAIPYVIRAIGAAREAGAREEGSA